jgi:two-component system response regulator NreC
MARAQATTRILLADDHVVVREVLRVLLDAEEDMEVVAEARNVDEVRRKVRGYGPDVLILDLNMPGGPSLEIIPTLREHDPELKVIVLTMEDSILFVQRAIEAGAVGYLLKDLASAELVGAVHKVIAGKTYITPGLGEPPDVR